MPSDDLPGGPTDPDIVSKFCKLAEAQPSEGRIKLGDVAFALRLRGVSNPALPFDSTWHVATDGDILVSADTFDKLRRGTVVDGFVLVDRLRYRLDLVGEFAELVPV
jgi:hypothetical protein